MEPVKGREMARMSWGGRIKLTSVLMCPTVSAEAGVSPSAQQSSSLENLYRTFSVAILPRDKQPWSSSGAESS
jgi:hypothetical protein